MLPDGERSLSQETSVSPLSGKARIVILASGTGSLFHAFLHETRNPTYPANVTALIVDRPCAAEKIAQEEGVPTHRVDPRARPDRESWDKALTRVVAAHHPTLIVSAGFMRILGKTFVDRFPGRIINSHPALLPAFPGAHAVRDALAHGVKVTGTTIHLVDYGVDTGPILAQESVSVETHDTEDSLHERIKHVERALLPRAVAEFLAGIPPTKSRKEQWR